LAHERFEDDETVAALSRLNLVASCLGERGGWPLTLTALRVPSKKLSAASAAAAVARS
jgi:hypothetical protein